MAGFPHNAVRVVVQDAGVMRKSGNIRKENEGRNHNDMSVVTATLTHGGTVTFTLPGSNVRPETMVKNRIAHGEILTAQSEGGPTVFVNSAQIVTFTYTEVNPFRKQPHTKPKKFVTDADRERIIDLYDSGKTLEWVALETGWSYSLVRNVIAEAGKTRPAGKRFTRVQEGSR